MLKQSASVVLDARETSNMKGETSLFGAAAALRKGASWRAGAGRVRTSACLTILQNTD
jgi:hypothetical protein